jgi:type IV pilus assembly protein PilN
VSWLIHAAVLRKISVTEQRISQLNQQIEGHKPQQARVEEFKKKKADIRSKLDVIQELELSRSGPVRLLDELATHIPERVWLTDLSARNGQLEINGMSLDNELIASFLTALSDSPYFENVELESTQLKEVKKLKLNSFRIRAALRTPREAGGEADPGAPRAAGVAG